MKKIPQFYILSGLTISIWFLSKFVSDFFLLTSKYRYYEANINKYLFKLHQQESSSINAKNNLRKWIKEAFPNKNVKDFFKNPNKINQSNKYICIGILSKNRINSNLNYVTKALMSILTRLSFNNWKQVSIIGFNLEEEPKDNKNLLELSDIIHIVNISSNIDYSEPKVKESMDYALILNELYNFNCKYSLVVEDDAVFSSDWYSRVKGSIDYINTNNKLNDWLCTKLFSGYKFYDNDILTDYSIMIKCALKSIILSFFVIISFNVINNLIHYEIFFSRKNIKNSRLTFKRLFLLIYYQHNKSTFFSHLIIVLNSFLVILWFKLTSINPLDTNNIRDFSARFGTVAVLYPYHQLLPFSQYLKNELREFLYNRNNNFLPKDLLLYRYKIENSFKEYTMEPSLVQHTGLHSTLHKFKLTQDSLNNMIRSYSFVDENNPIKFDSNFFDDLLNVFVNY